MGTVEPQGIAIVGGGIAGQALCEALRRRDPDLAITLVCGEPCLPYDRVRLSEILVSGEDPAALQLALTSGISTAASRSSRGVRSRRSTRTRAC